MRHWNHVLHSRALGSGVFGSMEILRRSEMTDQLMPMRVKGRLDLRHLRVLIPEQSSMRTLRSLMSEYRGIGISRGNDLDVLAWFAEQIAARRLHLVATPRETPTPAVPTQDGPTQAPMARQAHTPTERPTYTPPAPRVAPTTLPPQHAPSPPPPPPQTFAHVDQDQQAEVLETAARDGIPFCEECAKRARQLHERQLSEATQ